MSKAPDGWHQKYGPAVEESFRRKEPGLTDDAYKAKTRGFLDASWDRVTPAKRAEFEPKPGAAPSEDAGSFTKLFEDMFGTAPKKPAEERDLIAELLEW